ncbi:enediyne antibiotic chromoprotein [Streptomyces sp. NPDC044984]|uniref:enediyne antibiotic chromoprotein n=1 Tax=Streptomyces sp. NPDC044984 TaxID=3154335 RepID=UPI0033FB31B6
MVPISIIRNRAAKVVVGSAAVLGLAVGFQNPAVAVTAPTATVTPSSGLSDGTVVRVDSAGLDAGTAYDVGQCAWVGTGVLACNPADFSSVTADAGGSASTSLTVRRSFEGFLFDGTRWGTVDCTVVQCQVGLSDAVGNGPEGVPISFK